jgi:hypothetical protein
VEEEIFWVCMPSEHTLGKKKFQPSHPLVPLYHIGLVRLAGGWWLRLIYCERKILLAGWWLVAGAELV